MLSEQLSSSEAVEQGDKANEKVGGGARRKMMSSRAKSSYLGCLGRRGRHASRLGRQGSAKICSVRDPNCVP